MKRSDVITIDDFAAEFDIYKRKTRCHNCMYWRTIQYTPTGKCGNLTVAAKLGGVQRTVYWEKCEHFEVKWEKCS